MSLIITKGIRAIWGVPAEIKPILGLPDECHGRYRLKFRNTQAGRIYIKTKSGIECYVLEDRGYYWFLNPKMRQGRNCKA